MKDIKKYQGVIPAFYACYDAEGNISVEGVKALTRHLIAKGVKGVYVGGSSGECIYQHVEERKTVLEAVMSEAKGKLTVIAHVGCNNTADSMELARHAESVGVDAIASIPPIYFHLPEYAIAKYWNDMSAAAPNTEFVIYNIPQLAGTALTMSLLNEMLKNPNVVAVKNSSMPTQDIQMFKDAGIAARGEGNFVVFNGPDEQFVSGRVIGADGGIGGTYAVMPELYLAMNDHINKGEIQEAVGGSMWLVRDGKIVVNATDDYYTGRVSRTCVGITYDGQVVLMVLDGRQEPFSAGGSAIEIAQIMQDAGCVAAMNLDGGGSTTLICEGRRLNSEVSNMAGDKTENRAVKSTMGFFKKR